MDTSMIDACLLAHYLPALMLNQAMTSFKSQTRQKEWLCTRLLLKFIEGDNATIEYSSNGAPILLHSDKHISISHSGDFVAIALSTQQVGLDVQVINDKPLRLKSRFLSHREMTLLKSDEDVEGAVKLWCAKEAVYKLQGNKGVSFREHMRVLPFDYQEQGTLMLELSGPGRKETFKVYYEQFQEYMLGYVTE